MIAGRVATLRFAKQPVRCQKDYIVPKVSTSTVCECGGITGICGTAEGARKWRAHQQSNQHQEWEMENL